MVDIAEICEMRDAAKAVYDKAGEAYTKACVEIRDTAEVAHQEALRESRETRKVLHVANDVDRAAYEMCNATLAVEEVAEKLAWGAFAEVKEEVPMFSKEASKRFEDRMRRLGTYVAVGPTLEAL